MPADVRAADPLIGQTIGSYRIVETIGAGGMGTVYLAEQPAIGARVAVKVLSHHDARDPRANQRLFAEARAVNLIRHERIVNIIDLTTLPDGRPAVVMEHLSGQSLSEILSACGALPLASFAALIREVLAGLGAAHERDIIHRDLKPANIFVSPEGHAKLLDFGVAKFLDTEAAARLTAVGFVLGTVPYMAPEQATGDPVDARTDVFAAGAVLYEGATGVRPFQGRNVTLLCEEHERGPRRPSELRPEIPAPYESVILRALALEPRQRFASAAAMARALDKVSDGLPEAERRPLVPPIRDGVASPAHGAGSAQTIDLRGLSGIPPTDDTRPTAPQRPHARQAQPASIAVQPTVRAKAAAGHAPTPAEESPAPAGQPAAPPVQPPARPVHAPAPPGHAPAPPVQPPAPPPPERGKTTDVRRQARRWRVAALVALAAAALLGGALALYITQGFGDDPPPSAPGGAVTDAGRARTTAKTSPPTASDAAPPDAQFEAPDGLEASLRLAQPPPRLDPVAAIPSITDRLREEYPDASLLSLSFKGMHEDGLLHLDEGSAAGVTYKFVSTAGSTRDCWTLTVDIKHKSAQVDINEEPCNELVAIDPPRCTGRDLVERTGIFRAPSEQLLFVLREQGIWNVQRAQNQSMRFNDDCGHPSSGILE